MTNKDNSGPASDKIQQARRAVFEAWAPYRTDLNKDGFYASSHTRAQWSAFNAALDCVVIELALPTHNAWHDYDQGYNSALSDCRAAIKSTNLGIKIK